VHELGLALRVVEIASSRAEGARITRIVLEVGALAAVMPDALRSAFELASQGSSAQGATLQIEELPGRGRCRACGLDVAMAHPLAVCACGGVDIEWISGTELRVREMEVV
jgi:hydrogenase nickel incorporation protein HypA/HybF